MFYYIFCSFVTAPHYFDDLLGCRRRCTSSRLAHGLKSLRRLRYQPTSSMAESEDVRWFLVVSTHPRVKKMKLQGCCADGCKCSLYGKTAIAADFIPTSKFYAVREFLNKSAASAASPDYIKFQAVIKSAASAASLRGGRSSS